MRVEITLKGFEDQTRELRDQVKSRALSALARYGSLVELTQVRLVVADEQRSRVDCEVRVDLAGREEPVTAIATMLEPRAAAASCLDRCQRTIERQLDLSAIRRGTLGRSRGIPHTTRPGL